MQETELREAVVYFVSVFTSILYEAMPFIVLGALIAGLLEELVPQRIVTRLVPRNRILAIAIGGLLGALFPMCECGIIPIMRRLLRKGLPLSCCVCYMLGGPIINVVVMISTYVAFSGDRSDVENASSTPAMQSSVDASTKTPASTSQTESKSPKLVSRQFSGWQMAAWRLGLGYLVAFGTSLIVEWQFRKHGNSLLAPMARADVSGLPLVDDDDVPSLVRKPWSKRISNIAETTLHDFVDITVYLIIGGLLTSAVRLFLSRDAITTLASHPSLAIGIMMGLAILLCICSEADAFIAASYTLMPASSKLAFLVLGPMLDLKLYMMYTRVFRPRLIWTIITAVVVQVFIYSHIVHWLLEAYWNNADASLTGAG